MSTASEASPRWRTALITGASSGIGRALALELARAGTRVYVAARRQAQLDALVAEIAQEGGHAEALALDVACTDETHEAVRTLDARDPLDLVVANAGIGGQTPSTRTGYEEVRRILDVNLHGAVATLYGALPGMVARDRGHLAAVSSLAGLRGLPRFSAYCTAKAGLNTFLESLRVDLHKTGVAVTTICPGYVRTEMTAEIENTPFLVEADDAAHIIVEALRKKQALCAFPQPTAAAMRSVAKLPSALYEFLVTHVKLPY
jgi:short-subunit dehydrogenase